MIIILFLLTKILWTFLCQRRVKEIIFRSLDVFPSHAYRNCNDFIFYSGYMAGSLLMYLYIYVIMYFREGNGTPLQYSCLKIPWMEEPGRLQSMGLQRVVHDCTTSLPLFIFMHWRRKWQPTPVFLPGESQGRGSLVGCRLWGRTESDTTEATQQQQQ